METEIVWTVIYGMAGSHLVRPTDLLKLLLSSMGTYVCIQHSVEFPYAVGWTVIFLNFGDSGP